MITVAHLQKVQDTVGHDCTVGVQACSSPNELGHLIVWAEITVSNEFNLGAQITILPSDLVNRNWEEQLNNFARRFSKRVELYLQENK